MPRPLITLLIALIGVAVAAAEEWGEGVQPGVRYLHRELSEPRPLQQHILRIDLAHPQVELHMAVADDPDGDGPAEASLVNPSELAADAGLCIAVNTNAFGLTDETPAGSLMKYTAGRHADLIGLAVVDGTVRSPDQPNYAAAWADAEGAWQIGHPPADAKVQIGLAGFSPVLVDGQVRQGGDALHPRTALGLTADRRYLFLLVVDGRQSGYSEGMTTGELGETLAELGCHNAINLDGGGSTVLLMADATGDPRPVNRPSTRVANVSLMRPVPNVFGVRCVEAEE